MSAVVCYEQKQGVEKSKGWKVKVGWATLANALQMLQMHVPLGAESLCSEAPVFADDVLHMPTVPSDTKLLRK